MPRFVAGGEPIDTPAKKKTKRSATESTAAPAAAPAAAAAPASLRQLQRWTERLAEAESKEERAHIANELASHAAPLPTLLSSPADLFILSPIHETLRSLATALRLPLTHEAGDEVASRSPLIAWTTLQRVLLAAMARDANSSSTESTSEKLFTTEHTATPASKAASSASSSSTARFQTRYLEELGTVFESDLSRVRAEDDSLTAPNSAGAMALHLDSLRVGTGGLPWSEADERALYLATDAHLRPKWEESVKRFLEEKQQSKTGKKEASSTKQKAAGAASKDPKLASTTNAAAPAPSATAPSTSAAAAATPAKSKPAPAAPSIAAQTPQVRKTRAQVDAKKAALSQTAPAKKKRAREE